MSSSGRLATVSIVGLSGTDAQKGSTGVGKSTLCNRLVRPHFNDFYTEHITHLSWADFSCSGVINSDHWLYWGEVALDPTDYFGPTNRVRIIEQTVFLDDEGFGVLGSECGQRPAEYLKRALQVDFDSPNKIMYICRDQLGQETDYAVHCLDGHISVDMFVVVFDVSKVDGRSLESQSATATALIGGALKHKKPIFFVGTKCDKADVSAVQEFQRIVRLQKSSLFHWAETSAMENVNCAELLYGIAQIVDRKNKSMGRGEIPSFLEAQMARKEQIAQIISSYRSLLENLCPKEEFPTRRSRLSWPILLADFNLSDHPIYAAFVAEFGAQRAKKEFDEHLKTIRQWWLDRELSERLPAVPDVLRELFNRPFLCQATFEQLVMEMESHPRFGTFFRSASSERTNQNDRRIPAELLKRTECRQMFAQFQKELLDEIALERQISKFRRLLESKDAVTPGRKFSDVRVMSEEIAAFEKALPTECAKRVYEEHQRELRKKAQRDFNELLLENIVLFVDLVVEWRLKQSEEPNKVCSLTQREYNIICSALIENRRYRDMNGLADKRRELIAKMGSFVAMPLTCFCFAGGQCSENVCSAALSDIRHDLLKLSVIDLEVFGTEELVEEFVAAVKMVLSSEKHFAFGERTFKLNCFRGDNPIGRQKGWRVRSAICLIDSKETAQKLLDQSDSLFVTGPSPLFVAVREQNSENETIDQMGKRLADRFGGVLVMEEPSDLIADPFPDISSHFSRNELENCLREICSGQMGTEFADLRVRFSFLCDDPFSISRILSPLSEQSVQIDQTGGCFCVDIHMASKDMNIRVANHCGSYHHWLLSKWQLNTFQGHILFYSPSRRASWAHAEVALNLLLDSATVVGPPTSSLLERQQMAQSIMLIAVDDPANYFMENNRQLLDEGSQLAQRVGCRFAAVSDSMPQSAQFQLYAEFFAQILHNRPLPDSPYTVCSQNPEIFCAKRRPTYFTANANSTVTGSASTLLSSSQSSSQSSTVSLRPKEMSNRLRRPLSAIGSLIGSTTNGPTTPTSDNTSLHAHKEDSLDSQSDGFSKAKLSPSKFRRLFQRNTTGSESSVDSEQSRKKLHRSSTVDANQERPKLRMKQPEVVQTATPDNGYTTYVQIADSPPNSPFKRSPVRTLSKSHSMDENENEQRIVTFDETLGKEEDEERRDKLSRFLRFTERLTGRSKQRGGKRPKRGPSLPARRLASLDTNMTSPTSSIAPIRLEYETECHNGDEIPTFLKGCIQFIESNGGLSVVGLYRRACNLDDVAEYERTFGQTKSPPFDRLSASEEDIHMVGVLVRRYLKAFTDSLIPLRLYDAVWEVFKDRNGIEDPSPLSFRAIDSLRRLFQSELPRINSRTLMYLCAHLRRVDEHSNKNLMNAQNLTAIWNMVFFRVDRWDKPMDARILAERFRVPTFFLIKHFDVLFPM